MNIPLHGGDDLPRLFYVSRRRSKDDLFHQLSLFKYKIEWMRKDYYTARLYLYNGNACGKTV